MAAGSLAPRRAGHAARAAPDQLELLTALIGGPSFDPLYRPDVIRIPGDHPVYPWQCVVHDCERTRTGGRDLCHEHGKQWSEARGNGTGQAAFLTAARGLVAAVPAACRPLAGPAQGRRGRVLAAGRSRHIRHATSSRQTNWATAPAPLPRPELLKPERSRS